jgi:pyruvate,orthophosphate dikinase
MFFAEDRINIMQKMILAKTLEEREKYLDMLLPMQKKDFIGLFRAMNGYPVTIRLLDPPLHEFLPKMEDLMVEVTKLELLHADKSLVEEKKKLLERVEELHEFNPMLGLRGCRVGILYPEITRMQVRAIMEAACTVAKEKVKVYPEIMIPLVSMKTEMKAQKEIVIQIAEQVQKKFRTNVKYLVGTMIELPRAAICADEIAIDAEFFSFGTNDLTQTAYGFSRDDAGKFIMEYMNISEKCPECGGILEKDLSCPDCKAIYDRRSDNILNFDPFQTLDQSGVGDLIKIGVERGRRMRKDLKIGICGEHGGDPASVEFCHLNGFDYVSCSPYRIPIARLAAAHAVIKEKMRQKVSRNVRGTGGKKKGKSKG